MAIDISPNSIPIIPAKLKIQVPEEVSNMTQQISGWETNSNELSKGNLKLQADEERILLGLATAPLTGKGIFMGLDDTNYEFRAGDPAGAYIHWDGTNLTVTGITLSGGTLSYGKTSFSDSTNAGYYLSSAGWYVGAAADATKIKYTIADGTFVIKAAITTTSGSSLDGQYLSSASVTGTAIASATITATQIANGAITPVLTTIPTFILSAGTFTNNSPTATKVAWTSAKVVYNGTQHTISDSNTDAVYIIWDSASPTAFSGSATVPTTNTVFLVGINNSGTYSSVWDMPQINGIQIQANTITAGQITNATITATQIANATITATNIANATITATQIANATITGTQIAATTITAANITALTITAAEIANATITTGKIVSLNIDKLNAGTITSKAITLAVAAGTGDSYIAAGKTGFTNTDAGFILGIDDADPSDTAKFYIGDATHYLNWDDTNLNVVGGAISGSTIKAIESFTAGENLTAGNAVCIKNSSTTYYSIADTWANEADPTANYDDETTMRVGMISAKSSYSFVIFDESAFSDAEHILKAELHIHWTAQNGFMTTIFAHRVTASWAESTLTWNNKPAVTSDTSEPGGYYSYANPSTGADHYIDITNLVRNWKNGSYANYGLRLSNTEDNKYIDIATFENATESYRVSLIITYSNQSDGKVYKTDSDDYLLSRNLIGIATETVNADASCKVQTSGKNTNIICSPGDIYYVGTTAGAISNSVANQVRLIRVGKGTTTNELLIDMNDSDVFLSSFSGSITAPSTAHTLPFPPDAKYALVSYLANSVTAPWGGSVRINTVLYTSLVVRNYDSPNSYGFSLVATYSNNGMILTINSGTANNIFSYTVYFYK